MIFSIVHHIFNKFEKIEIRLSMTSGMIKLKQIKGGKTMSVESYLLLRIDRICTVR